MNTSLILKSAKMLRKMKDKILVTGGCGYIASHTLTFLLQSYDVVIVDNLSNSSEEATRRVQQIVASSCSNAEPCKVHVRIVDMCDMAALAAVFAEFTHTTPFKSCIHFAGLKAVGESITVPLLYYQTNITSTLNLLALLEKHGTKSVVFSSSATVYGSQTTMPITEDTPVGAGITNAYGRTKFFIEGILQVSERGAERSGV